MKTYAEVIDQFITAGPKQHEAVMQYLARHYSALDQEIDDTPATRHYVTELIAATVANCPVDLLPDVVRLTLKALTMGVIIGLEMKR